MPIYTYIGATIEVAKGGQSAKATRHEVRDDAGNVLQAAASKEFKVIGEPDAPTPQVQAERWVQSLMQKPIIAADVMGVVPAKKLTKEEAATGSPPVPSLEPKKRKGTK